eukprot:7387566-Prymnesium_polylepis.1
MSREEQACASKSKHEHEQARAGKSKQEQAKRHEARARATSRSTRWGRVRTARRLPDEAGAEERLGDLRALRRAQPDLAPVGQIVARLLGAGRRRAAKLRRGRAHPRAPMKGVARRSRGRGARRAAVPSVRGGVAPAAAAVVLTAGSVERQ